MNDWDAFWLGMAKYVSSKSKDPSTKVGAVIADGKKFISFGYNGFPASCPDKEEWLNDRPTKYKLVTHAEVNAILNAPHPVVGCSLYTYPLGVCPSCAGIVSAAGISRVISLIDRGESSTKVYHDLSDTEFIFNANGIEYTWLNQ